MCDTNPTEGIGVKERCVCQTKNERAASIQTFTSVCNKCWCPLQKIDLDVIKINAADTLMTTSVINPKLRADAMISIAQSFWAEGHASAANRIAVEVATKVDQTSIPAMEVIINTATTEDQATGAFICILDVLKKNGSDGVFEGDEAFGVAKAFFVMASWFWWKATKDKRFCRQCTCGKCNRDFDAKEALLRRGFQLQKQAWKFLHNNLLSSDRRLQKAHTLFCDISIELEK